MINTLGLYMVSVPCLIVIFIGFVLPIFLVVKVISYFKRSNAERHRLRMEISKLADELEQTRKNRSKQ